LIEKIKNFALLAHKACQVRGYSRIDFRVRPDGSPFVLEINTLPGCTQTSLLPKAAAQDGISFPEVIQTLLNNARLDYESVC
jgi:D-alanine-D-alanine ligase